MKTTILLLFLALASCSKDSAKQDPIFQLPPETQTGENTFGCLVGGKLFYPRDGIGDIMGNAKGVRYFGSASSTYQYDEIYVANFIDAKPLNYMYFHLHDLPTKGAGEYIWKESNFNKGIDGLMQNYLYVRAYDYTSNTWKWYTSYENSGKTIIKRYDIQNRIVSAIFSGKLKTADGKEEIEITQGRFDINWSTLPNTNFQ